MNQKNKQLYHTKNHKNLPVWNLKDLYTSPKSENLEKDLVFLNKKTKFFEKKYFKNISKLNAIDLHKAIKELEKIDMIMDKVISYAHLLVTENINHEENKIFYQQVKEKIT